MSILNQIAPKWQVRTLEGGEAPAPTHFLGRPLLVLFWGLGCPACKSRALPFSKELLRVHPTLQVVGIHTRFEGPKYSAGQIGEMQQLYKIAYPFWIDLGMKTYERYEAEGTPHWTLIRADGIVHRTIFGSMPNALQRLDYALIELIAADSTKQETHS